MARTRRETGVPGLDEVLDGGLLSGSLYIVRGAPGAGKTTLASQICFAHAAQRERALYVSLLAESHDRLLENLEALEFYEPEHLEQLRFLSAFHALHRDGLDGVLQLFATEARRSRSTLIVLDGLSTLQQRTSADEIQRFINQLQSLAQITGGTMLLLTNSMRDTSSPEYTMVDGWLELGARSHDVRLERFLQVHKYRGSDFMTGRHAVTLTSAGVRVLPRFESQRRLQHHPLDSRHRLSTGIERLDGMLDGGLRRGSATLLIGPSGIGKTSFGLHFLDRSRAEEPGLMFGFYESRADLLEKAQLLGLAGVDQALEAGHLEVIWRAPTEQSLDALAYELLGAVRRRKVQRVFIDGVNGFRQAAIHPQRLSGFLAALTNALHSEGATTLFSLGTHTVIGAEPELDFTAASPIAQNMILLRFDEINSRVRRHLTIIKCRTSAFDERVREFAISGEGIRIGEVFQGQD